MTFWARVWRESQAREAYSWFFKYDEMRMTALAPEFFLQGTPDFSILLSKIEAQKPDRIVGYFLRAAIAPLCRPKP